MTTRRDFLATSARAGGALFGAPRLSRAHDAVGPATTQPAKLNLLVLGGTGFIGPHL